MARPTVFVIRDDGEAVCCSCPPVSVTDGNMDHGNGADVIVGSCSPGCGSMIRKGHDRILTAVLREIVDHIRPCAAKRHPNNLFQSAGLSRRRNLGTMKNGANSARRAGRDGGADRGFAARM